jgi:hypothetical protein
MMIGLKINDFCLGKIELVFCVLEMLDISKVIIFRELFVAMKFGQSKISLFLFDPCWGWSLCLSNIVFWVLSAWNSIYSSWGVNDFLRWATVVEKIFEGCGFTVQGCYVEFSLYVQPRPSHSEARANATLFLKVHLLFSKGSLAALLVALYST